MKLSDVPVPTPSNDPTGFVAAITGFTTVLFLAVDPAGDLLGRWQPVVQAGVILVSLAWARTHAFKPSSVDDLIDTTAAITKASVLHDISRLAPPPAPPKKRATRPKKNS